jgi:DNA polymerase I
MDPLLYGSDGDERIVAVQHVGDGTVRLYRRLPSGTLSADVEFYPFFFLSDSSFLGDFTAKHWIRDLQGRNYFRTLCVFTRWSDMWDGIHHVMRRYNDATQSTIESYTDLPILYLRPDPTYQYLMQSGKTLFKGMEFGELHRLQLDIETYTKQGGKFSNAERPDDRIIVIALSDETGWEYVIDGRSLSERAMLEQMVQIIRERDPDVIEGHNILNFDLPYISTRCAMLHVEFAIGRDGSTPRAFDARTSFAERAVDYRSHDVAGRHIVDTWLLAQAYDVSKRSLESYGLKYLARYFGFARQDRIYIQADKISWYWDNEPELLVRYALDDVHETRMLSEYLSPTYFQLARMVPFNFDAVTRIGSAAKIESLIVREYVRQKHSLPAPEPGVQKLGGYTDVFVTGVLGPILHVDVDSLYPSIMLSVGIAPKSETLGVFQSLLRNLTTLRLEAKRAARAESNPARRAQLDALQASFKILINSFYGYLGYARALFEDVEAADRVTEEGQRILRSLIRAIGGRLGTVVEVDTDGIFFIPPPSVSSEADEAAFVTAIASELPTGITLSIGGRYRKMLSYKKKNYALLDYENRVSIKGSSLISRSMERFGRNFIQQCIDALLNNNIRGLHELYVNLYRDIVEHRLNISDLARVETLKDDATQYHADVAAGRRNRSAAYEVALASGTSWNPGERMSYYITGTEANVRGFESCKPAEEWDPNFPDENVQYYLKRLNEFAEKFEVFFRPQDFRAIFSVEDLFGFSADGISVQTIPVARETRNAETDDGEQVELRIWLDTP